MVLDLLAAAADARLPFALEIFERTASTPRVQQVVQLSLAPAFLLSGIGAIMNVIMSRMIWIARRVENIEEKLEEHRTPRQTRELGWLMRRRRLMQGAIMFSTASAVSWLSSMSGRNFGLYHRADRHADRLHVGADDGAAGDGPRVLPAGNAAGRHRRAGAQAIGCPTQKGQAPDPALPFFCAALAGGP